MAGKRCYGQCKRPYTKDFTPEVLIITPSVWQFLLHDTLDCPDRVKWHMNALMTKAKALRDGR